MVLLISSSAEPNSGQTAVVEKPLSVHGTVETSDGSAAVGVPVTLWRHPTRYDQAVERLTGTPSGEPVAKAQTGENGRFTFQVDEPAVFRVEVHPPRGVPVAYAPVPVAGRVELPPVRLGSPGALAIRLHNGGDGGPVAGASIRVRTSLRSPVPAILTSNLEIGWEPGARQGRTDERGRFLLPRRDGELVDLEIRLRGSNQVQRVDAVEQLALVIEPAIDPPSAEPIKVVDLNGDPAKDVVISRTDGRPLGLTDDRGLSVLAERMEAGSALHLLGPDGARKTFTFPEPRGSEPLSVVLPRAQPLRGRVVSAPEGTPVSGALVWHGNDPGIQVVTDAEGGFSTVLAETRGAFFEARATATGFVTLSDHVGVTAAEDGPDLRPVELRLEPAGRIAGQVVDRRGRQVPGSTVEALPVKSSSRRSAASPEAAERPLLARTGPSGHFVLTSLVPEQEYRLTARKRGFEPSTAEALSKAGALDVSARLVLQPSVVAFGRVLDERGEPVADARIAIRAAGTEVKRRPRNRSRHPEESLYEILTDREGIFRVQVLPSASTFDLEVIADGFPRALVRGVQAPADRAPVDLGAIYLEPATSVSGRVVDESGNGVADAGIWVQERQTSVRALSDRLAEVEPDTRSGSDGSFALNEVGTEQRVFLLVHADSYVPVAVPEVRAGDNEPIEVVLSRGGGIDGRVTDLEGRSVPSARVRTQPAEEVPGVVAPRRTDAERVYSAKADDRGRFGLDGLPPGRYSVEAVTARHPHSDPEVVEIRGEGDRATVTLVLAPGATVEGIVTSGEHGEPVDGARVLAEDSGTLTDDRGTFRLEGARPGRRTLEVRHPEFETTTRVLELVEGEHRADFELESGLTVSGSVVDSSRLPVDRAVVTLSGGRRWQEYRATTGPDGSFDFGRVGRGTYRVQARKKGYSVAELASGIEVSRVPITGLEVVLRRGSAVVGDILGLDAAEIAAVQVEAQRVEPSVANEIEGARDPVRGRVSHDGSFEVQNLPAGVWRVRGYLPDGRREATAMIDVRDDGPGVVRRNLEFPWGFALSGQVFYQASPVPGAQVELRRPEGARRATRTDARGRFSLEDLEAGHYRLEVSHSRQLLVDSRAFDLENDLDLRIEIATFQLAGQVTAPDRRGGVPDALVMVRRVAPTGEDGNLHTVATDAQGRFQFARLSAGQYRIEVRGKRLGHVSHVMHLQSDTLDLQLVLQPPRNVGGNR